MGVFKGLSHVWISLFFILMTTPYCFLATSKTDENGGNVSSSSNQPLPLPPPPPPPPAPPPQRSTTPPFKPSVAVIVGVLTTIFSITFLLLLYAKHCKDRNGYTNGASDSRGIVPSTGRKNSGIDRAVIESLPVFRFGSLQGQKEGLECAVCLNMFESIEVLRLLPKCKHAFHVECVDTWLDAHSTCPLCRYRVDPEDILLVRDNNTNHQRPPMATPPQPLPEEEKEMTIRRVSGRHSSAGERGSRSFGNVVEKPGESETLDPTSLSTRSRRSLDYSNLKNNTNTNNSFPSNLRENTRALMGCFDRTRKDGLLLNEGPMEERRQRLEHRIIVSNGANSGLLHHNNNHRWSDIQPLDLLYLRSEMIISENQRISGGAGSSSSRGRRQKEGGGEGAIDDDDDGENNGRWQRHRHSGRSVINSRSVSEITGLSRLATERGSNEEHCHYNVHRHRQQQQQRQARVVSRWLAWISQSQPAVPSHQTSLPV